MLGGYEMLEVVKLWALFVVTLAIAISCCAITGGSRMIDVRGALPASAGECLLDFIVAETGRVKMTQPAQGDFGVRIVLSGGVAQRYHFAARCLDGRVYRSEEMTIGMSDDVIKVNLFPIES